MADFAIGGNLPRGDANGAAAIATQMITDPMRKRVLLVVLDCPTTKRDNVSGEHTAVARICRIEAVLPRDLAAAEQMMRRTLELRSGQTVLPLELEQEVAEAFSDVDLDDPEGKP